MPALALGGVAVLSMVAQLPLKSLDNFRDVGGLPCGAGTRIRKGVLFRAGSPATISEADKRDLEAAYGELSVLDLRKMDETHEDQGDRLLHGQTTNIELLSQAASKKRLAKYVFTSRLPSTIPLMPFWMLRAVPIARVQQYANRVTDEGVRRFLDTIELTDVYWWILCDQSAELRQAIEACVASPPTLVHCAHGKDRTGVLIAVMLHICGASLDTIAQDYAKSDAWGCSADGQWMMLNAMPSRYRERIQRWSGAAPPEEVGEERPVARWEQFGRWCRADATTMYELWGWVERRHGSMDGYLDHIGVDAKRRAEIRAALTEPA